MLLSDYAKGVLTARVIRNVIDAARKLGKRVIVDPKSANFAIYRGATLLTPNRKEFAEATRSRADTDQNIADAAQDAMHLADCEAMLVTQSEHGMTLVARGGEAIHVPALAGQGARRLRRGRHGRRGAGADAGGRGRLGDGAADGECGRRGCGRQEGHRHRDAGGAAAENPAACVAGGRGKDRARQAAISTRISRTGAGRGCASASPMAASTFCIPATSRC